MVQKEDDKMISNVNKCFIAQRKMVSSMLDNGYELSIP